MTGTEQQQDRTTWPPMVTCKRPALIHGECVGHQDCRAAYWRRHDGEQRRSVARGFPVVAKSRVVSRG